MQLLEHQLLTRGAAASGRMSAEPVQIRKSIIITVVASNDISTSYVTRGFRLPDRYDGYGADAGLI